MNNAETDDANQASSRRPSHVAYSVKDREGTKSEWRPIGVAWQHADGKGMNMVLDLMPFDGRITLRAAPDEKKE